MANQLLQEDVTVGVNDYIYISEPPKPLENKYQMAP